MTRHAIAPAWILAVALVLLGGSAAGAGCATTEKEVAFEAPVEAGPSFVADANADAADAAGMIPLLCAVNACPTGRVTCPESLYPCQVDLMTDSDNCGACGNACPYGTQAGAQFACVGGACVVSCKSIDGVKVLDCNGYSGDGCEVSTNVCDQAHCGSCAPCAAGTECVNGKLGVRCGCETGLIQCGIGCDATCTTEESDDKNCGACGKVCDPAVGTPLNAACPSPDATYYGCRNKTCGQVKCQPGFADCNNDIARCPTDGCEANLQFDDQNCGACGNKCAESGQCILGVCQIGVVCKPGQVACSSGVCVDLGLDPLNCGACGHACDDGAGTCVRGECAQTCPLGFADCDGFGGNGCETDILHDPEHCGGCATSCDLPAGQPCIDGLCLRGPCGPGETK